MSYLNIVIAGDKSVGKSSLIKSFIIDKDDDGSSVKDGSIFMTKVTIDYQTFTLKITEQSGLLQPDDDNNNTNQNNPFIRRLGQNFNKTHAQVIVYDIANQESFDFIKKWVFQNRTGEPTILLANQCDLFPKGIEGKEEKLSYGYCRNNGPKSQPNEIMKLCSKYYGAKVNGEKYSKQNNMSYFEVSAKTKMNVDAALKSIAKQAKDNFDRNNIVYQSPRMLPPMIIDRRPVREHMIQKQFPPQNKVNAYWQQPPQSTTFPAFYQPPQFGQQQQQQQQQPQQQQQMQQQMGGYGGYGGMVFQQPPPVKNIPPPPPDVAQAPTPVNVNNRFNVPKMIRPVQYYDNVKTKDQDNNCHIM